MVRVQREMRYSTRLTPRLPSSPSDEDASDDDDEDASEDDDGESEEDDWDELEKKASAADKKRAATGRADDDSDAPKPKKSRK